jgi:RNA-binding protein YhbY
MAHLIKYLKYTPKVATVYVNIFGFNYLPVLNAIEKAYRRGVVMHVMIDSSNASTVAVNQNSLTTLHSLFKKPSNVIAVSNDIGSPATGYAIDHNKYVLFSEIDLPQGIVKHAVFATSENFGLATTKKVQDAVVMSSKGLYKAFLRDWNQIAKYAHSGMRNFTYIAADLDSMKVFFFPRRENGEWDGHDTVIEQLDKLSNYTMDTVRVFMADWTRVKIAQKLTALKKKGTTVQVITRSAGQGVSKQVIQELDRLKTAGGYVKILDITKENDHSKCMLIKGTFNGKKRQIILTGSHNYTYNALKRNDEFLLMLKNSALFDDYWNYFGQLKKIL